MRAEVAYELGAELGEGPTWDARTGRLIVVDILRSRVHQLSPGGDQVLQTAQHVGAAKPRASGGLVVNLRDGVGCYSADGAFSWLAEWPVPGRRGNDAAVDPWGRLWAGTMRYDEGENGGCLYRVGETIDLITGATVSNGIAWSPDNRLMYYIDSHTRRIDVFDVDADSGLVRDRRTLATVETGFPDGMTVDADGCLWVAVWDGSAVHRYTPDGRLDRVVEVPCARPTACTFGGADLRDLYITTATIGLDDPGPYAGSVLVIPGAGQGLPSPAFAW